MPRLTTSSASSWPVQWVMGRPDLAGGSQATARIWVTCSGVNLPGAQGRGSSERVALDAAPQVGLGLPALQLGEALPGRGPQRRRRRPGAVQADLTGDVFIASTVEGREDDRRVAGDRGGGDGVAEGAEDLVLTFSDDDLGSLARHGALAPGDRGSSEVGQF